MVRLIFTIVICSLCLSLPTGIALSQPDNGNKDKQEEEAPRKVRPEVEEALETLYPVPIKKGESIKLAYDMPEDGKLMFEVKDFKGEKHFGFSESFEAGDNNISFNTSGLEVGNYIVEVSGPQAQKEKEIMLTVVR